MTNIGASADLSRVSPVLPSQPAHGRPLRAAASTTTGSRRYGLGVKDTKGAFREVPFSLDTLYAEPDEGTIKLTWRGVGPVVEDDFADVATILLVKEPLGEPRAVDDHRAAL